MEIQESEYVTQKWYEFSYNYGDRVPEGLFKEIAMQVYNTSLTKVYLNEKPNYTGQGFILENSKDSSKCILVGFVAQTDSTSSEPKCYNSYFITCNVEQNSSNVIGYNAYKVSIDPNYILSCTTTTSRLQIIRGTNILSEIVVFGNYESTSKETFTIPPKGIFLEYEHCNVVPQEYIGEINIQDFLIEWYK